MECRTCLKITNDFRDLFTEDCDLSHKIEAISSIQILANEQFPSKICYSCVTSVELLYDFCGVVRRSNIILESRACGVHNEETGESKLEDDLIQIDEIKLESESENSCFDEPVETKEEVKESAVSIRRKKRGKRTVKKKVDLNWTPCESESETTDSEDSVEVKKEVIKVEVPKVKTKREKKVYNCTKCDFTSEQYKFLRTHQKIHKVAEELRSICNICGKLVSTDYLSQHVSIHNATPVTCYICEKVLKHKDSLKKHMRVHQEITIQCTYCGKICTNRQCYYKHVRRHKDGGVKTFKCPMCEKDFHEKKFLTKHIRSHTGERPYPCEYCLKGFSSPYALKTHIRRHTNEKPFVCEFCDMAFMVRVSLKTHIKSKHPNKTLE